MHIYTYISPKGYISRVKGMYIRMCYSLLKLCNMIAMFTIGLYKAYCTVLSMLRI